MIKAIHGPKPTKVNQDQGASHQFLTWMDIDQTTGELYFVYYDRRNHDGNATDVYLAYSSDGGQNYTETKISERSFTPNPEVFFGDYSNIAAHRGVVRPVWTVLNEMELSVHTALIDVDLIREKRNRALDISIEGSALNVASLGSRENFVSTF